MFECNSSGSYEPRQEQTHAHCSPADLSRGWLRIFRITKAMEIASLDEVSEKGTLKGDQGAAAHPGCHTV